MITGFLVVVEAEGITVFAKEECEGGEKRYPKTEPGEH